MLTLFQVLAMTSSSTSECVLLVLLEMGLAISGIISNLLVVTTVRNVDRLQSSTHNLLLANLCFSNILISFIVKPISAIYVGYAISTGQWKVGLAFCSLYTLTYRTTWCVLPTTIVCLFWHIFLVTCPPCRAVCCTQETQATPTELEMQVMMLMTIMMV